MKRAAVAAVTILIGFSPSAAFCYDWSLTSTQTEAVEANDNIFLRSSALPGWASYSTLTANAEGRTADSKVDFDVNSSYRRYWGPATYQNPNNESLNYFARGHYEHYDNASKFDREFIEASWSQSSSAFALQNELGIIVPTRGFLDRATYTGGIDRSITKLDTVSLFATATQTSYDPSGGGTPLTDTLARGVWRHTLNPNLATNVSSEGELIDYDNATKTHVEIYRNQLGVDTSLSPLLSFRANAGAILISTENGTNPLATLGSSTAAGAATSSTLLDWIGSATLTYKMLKDTTLSVFASQSTGPSVVGSLFKTDVVSLSINHIINSHSNLTFSASAAETTSTTTTPVLTGAVTYSHTILRDLTAQLTYRYTRRLPSTGGTTVIDPITGTPTTAGLTSASSNSIMLVVSRSYTVLPRGY